jgi:hypothetical protein
MSLSRFTWDNIQSEIETRQMLEAIRTFEHWKLKSCPYKKPCWRPKKSVNYKYDPNKSDTVTVFEDMTKWRQ